MRRLALGVLVAMVAGAAFASPASAAFPGRNGPITTVLIPAGITMPACLVITELIDVMRADGTHQRSLGTPRRGHS